MRIRSIKPEFCSDEKIGALSPAERLHFILIWMLCDKHGVFEYKPRQLAVQLYPYDAKMDAGQFQALTTALLQQGLCSTAVVDGKHYCRVSNFNKHQILTSWERKDSKPLLTPKQLRQHFGSTAEVLPSEERREVICDKSPPIVPQGDASVSEESSHEEEPLPDRLKPAYEKLQATGKMRSITPWVIQQLDAAYPNAKFLENIDHYVEILKQWDTTKITSPRHWLEARVKEYLEKNKTRLASSSASMGGECLA